MSTESFCHPFNAFQWTADSLPQLAVGSSAAEASQIAHVLTRSAYDNEKEVDEAVHIATFSAHLRRLVSRAHALIKHLAQRSTAFATHNVAWVSVNDVGAALHCHWQEVDVEHGELLHRIDPYFWRMLRSVVSDSVNAHLEELDKLVAGLPGIDAAFVYADGVNEQLQRTKNAMRQLLTTKLLSRDATVAGVVRALRDLQAKYTPAHIDAMRTLLLEQARCVNALVSLVCTPEAILEEAVQTFEKPIARLLHSMPGALRRGLEQRGLCVETLRLAFESCSNGLVVIPSSTAPPSLAVRCALISHWLLDKRGAVCAACNNAIAELRTAADRPSDAVEWSDVALCTGEERQTVVHVPAPAHLCAATDTATATHFIAFRQLGQRSGVLRIARLFDAVVDEVRHGALPPLHVHAHRLLPIVSRIAAEAEIGLEQLGHVPRQRTQRTQCAKLHARATVAHAPLAVVPATGPAASKRSTAETVLATTSDPAVMAAQLACVGPGHERDHAILSALCRCLKPCVDRSATLVTVRDVTATALAMAPVLNTLTASQLSHAIGFCCKRVVDLANVQCKENEACYRFSYQSEQSSRARGVPRAESQCGISCEGEGAEFVLQYTQWCIHQMRYAGTTFVRTWPYLRLSTGSKRRK